MENHFSELRDYNNEVIHQSEIKESHQFKKFSEKWQQFIKLCDVIGIIIQMCEQPLFIVHQPEQNIKHIAYAFIHTLEFDRILYQCKHSISPIKIYLNWGIYDENVDEKIIAHKMSILASVIDCKIEYTDTDKNLILYIYTAQSA